MEFAFKLMYDLNDVGERCAAKEQWRFQCDDGRRTAIKTALNTKIEDGSHLPEEDGERCAAKEQWRFQCDDGRRTAIKTALNTKIEDGSHLPEEDGRLNS
ncbi:hypothetical protein T4D_11752 [Trichinella pseudospiralis]|uniref:Uncharacterized protein n=1 Tax=Trichinella pseudospiralis TaxID=6337 RepID=A0A0V1F8M0_TRIPS|nr:hypothetical protein T4D_11752 [Trichinella pseudospiralis]